MSHHLAEPPHLADGKCLLRAAFVFSLARRLTPAVRPSDFWPGMRVILALWASGCATNLPAQDGAKAVIPPAAPVNAGMLPGGMLPGGMPTAEAQLDQFKKSELAFVVRVCQLGAEEQQVLEGLGGKLKAETLKKRQAGERARGASMFQALLGDSSAFGLDSRAIAEYRKSLEAVFHGALTAEQQTKYAAELEARHEFQKQANAECLVSILDRQLCLLPEQFQPLIESLKNWEDVNDLRLSFYFENTVAKLIPPIPAQYYENLLTAEQLEVLKSCRQVREPRDSFIGNMLPW